MFCPKCGAEYRPGFTECTDCFLPLVAEPPEETAHDHPTMKGTRGAYDVAYSCFLLSGLILLGLAGVRLSSTEAEWQSGGGAVFFLLLPLIFIPAMAMIVGIALALHIRTHWPLVALAAGTILIVAGAFMESVPESVEMRGAIIYGVMALAACIFWFAVLRRKSFPAPDHPTVELMTIFRSGNPAIIPLAKSLLESADISFVTKGEQVQDLVGWGRFPAGLNPAIGPVEFQVSSDDAEQARQLLAELEETGGSHDSPGTESDDA